MYLVGDYLTTTGHLTISNWVSYAEHWDMNKLLSFFGEDLLVPVMNIGRSKTLRRCCCWIPSMRQSSLSRNEKGYTNKSWTVEREWMDPSSCQAWDLATPNNLPVLKSRLEHQELGYSWKYLHSWLLTVNEAAIYSVERCLKLLPGKNRDATGIRLAHSEEMAKEFQGIMQLKSIQIHLFIRNFSGPSFQRC